MKNIKKLIIIILIITIIVAYSNISIAASKNDLKNEQVNLNTSINEAKEDLKEVEKEKSKTLDEVEKLLSQIADYQEEIDGLNSQISNLETQIKNAINQIEEDEKEYQRQQNALNERLIAIYENGDISYLDVLLSSTSLTDFISSYYMVSELTSYDVEMLKIVEEQKQKIEKEKEELEEDKGNLDKAKESKVEKSKALKVAKSKKEEEVTKLSQEEKDIQKDIEEMLEDKAKIDKELQRIAKEEAEAAAKKAAEASNNGNTSGTLVPSAPSSAGYIFPVAGLGKSSIRKLVFPSYAGHTGIDVNINVTGKSVVAVKDGTVSISTALKNPDGSYRSYGEYVAITHDDGTMTVYAHMLAGSRTVKKGDRVKQGQKIGIVGSTGNSTGTHLHFEVRILTKTQDGYTYKPVNPIPYLP